MHRTHQCAIGVLHEIYNDPEAALDVEHAETATHKGDFFTKELNPMQFQAACSRVGLRRSGIEAGKPEQMCSDSLRCEEGSWERRHASSFPRSRWTPGPQAAGASDQHMFEAESDSRQPSCA